MNRLTRNVTLTHTTSFTQCIQYTVTVAAQDKAGLSLIPGPAANPFSFIVECINPYITATDPMDLQGDVVLNAPVIVDFSKAMSRPNTVLTISPDVVPKAFTGSAGDTRLMMTHSASFVGCRAYTVTVTGTDTAGNSLIPGPPGSPPNPWQFVTVCPNPYIVATQPADGETNVAVTQPILIGFSTAMNTASVLYTIAPAVTGITETWGADQQLQIDHDPFLQCTLYTVEVTQGQNTAGLPLVPGPAPNPWSFSTIC